MAAAGSQFLITPLKIRTSPKPFVFTAKNFLIAPLAGDHRRRAPFLDTSKIRVLRSLFRMLRIIL
jgi:hypothetical protein